MSGGRYTIRSLPELPGYAIASDGRIKGPSGKWLACTPSGNGYRSFATGTSPQKFWYVHQVVAMVYLGSPPSLAHEVAHLNGNPLDNHIDNLAWKTRAENQADRLRHGTSNRGERHPQSKLTAYNVSEIRQRYATGGVLQRDLAAQFGVARKTISLALRGVTWGHVGNPGALITGPNHPSARKTHCPRGHAYSEENTYLDSRGFRNCRKCKGR